MEPLPIKERPWESQQKSKNQHYQCYCKRSKKEIEKKKFEKLKTLKKFKELKKKNLKTNRTGLSNGKSLPYQDGMKIQLKNKSESMEMAIKTFQLTENSLTGQFLKTFQIKYKFPLSLTGRTILISFSNKYIYYAIDDILYLLDSNPKERDNLLAILYSSMLSLQNDFSVNFFDIWIDSVYVNQTDHINRFLKNKRDKLSLGTETTITLKLHYFTRVPIQKPEPIW